MFIPSNQVEKCFNVSSYYNITPLLLFCFVAGITTKRLSGISCFQIPKITEGSSIIPDSVSTLVLTFYSNICHVERCRQFQNCFLFPRLHNDIFAAKSLFMGKMQRTYSQKSHVSSSLIYKQVTNTRSYFQMVSQEGKETK